MLTIEAELRANNLWEVYQRDVVDLEPILVHMHQKGMPVDAEIRSDRAIKLDQRLREVRVKMESSVPKEARRIEKVFARRPKDVTGLESRPGVRRTRRCSVCGAERPGKGHFKTYKRKVNPCCQGEIIDRDEEATEYYRLAPFTPSRDQLIRYHHYLRRPLPMVFDKKAGARKVSFGERQLKDLVARYPSDVLYSLILTYRELDKIAGTYIGRLSGSGSAGSS
jgi:hypothetical protein